MINSLYSLSVDASGKELIEKNTQLFDLSLNDMDMHQYAGGYVPPHWHSELELFVLLTGTVTLRVGDCTHEIKAGEGCFINTERIHSVLPKTSAPCHFRSFVFSTAMIGGTPESVFHIKYLRPLLENGPSCFLFQAASDATFFEQFDAAYQACIKESFGFEFQARNALSNILLYILSKVPANSAHSISAVQDKRLKIMLTWMHQNFDKNITISQIAGTASICPRECQRIFQQYLHYSPIEYLNRIRIFHAAKQLTDTDAAITDIGLSCGFTNPSYFSKQFKTIMGSTPSEYRAASHKNSFIF